MTTPATSSSIVRNLQITFTVSIALLVISLISSFYSVQELIDNSKLVNTTNEVLIESENVSSYLKDGETGQRGYLITLDSSFLEPYYGSKAKAIASCKRIRKLTDSTIQKNRIQRMLKLIDDRYEQLERVILVSKRREDTGLVDTIVRYQELLEGKAIMDEVRTLAGEIKTAAKEKLDRRLDQQAMYINTSRILVILAALISILISVFAYIKIKKDLDQRIARQKEDERKYAETNRRIADLEVVTGSIAQGDFARRSTDVTDDELGRIGKALNNMGEHLQANFEELEIRSWQQEGTVQLGDAMRGERNVRNLSVQLLNALTSYIGAPVAAIYITDRNNGYGLIASHGLGDAPKILKGGEGLTGQALLNQELKVWNDLPGDYLRIGSSTGSTAPVSVVVLPLVFEGISIGVIEIGMLRPPQPHELELLTRNMEMISIAINAALDHQTLQNLLEETQAQSEELQAQHSELENLNSELEAQAQSLQASEEELKVQQEELQQTNAELEERTLLLEEKNKEIQHKAEELALTTRYKSEFLANMSHELRTPLNSILLLSRLLSDNSENNLNADQVEYARVIQSSGNGLLWLIDEILDLSKIEAGKMELEFEQVQLKEITKSLTALFKPLAEEKKIGFEVTVAKNAPELIETDRMRLEQILKNLLSNAIKFTSSGSVTLKVGRCSDNKRFVCFSVKDTGIGIPQEKQHLVFEAFQQADGSTRRKYGGTGLGLSISRELVKLLGGEIKLVSEAGEGSEFTIYVPAERFRDSGKEASETIADAQPQTGQKPAGKKEDPHYTRKYVPRLIPDAIPDDRDEIREGDNCILIVEDDPHFATSVLEFTRKKGYKGIVSVRGDMALPLAIQYSPTGILLDVELPMMNGWEVMDALKSNPETRHIPVHMMSSHSMRKRGIQKGAVDFIEKPVAFEQMQDVFQKIEDVLAKSQKKVLIIEDNAKHAEALAFFLDTHDISSEVKKDVAESIEALKHSDDLDCVILDMGIPAERAYEVLEEMKTNEGLENLPIIIFTGKSLSMSEEQRIRKYADSIVIKTAHSYQRMLDEVSLFLHLVEEKKNTQPVEYKRLGALNEVLNHKTVLIADDDIRNIFSLSKALEGLKMHVITAIDGREALRKLDDNPEVDIVLLDMMMPEMDGYETARRIRSIDDYKNLPVIAVTAKAMTGDREKCIAAGASDYITKPVDIDQLLSLLRVWLYDN